MNFIVSSSALQKQLKTISGVIPANPVIAILDNFKFQLAEGILRVTVNDLQTAMTLDIPVESKDNGSICVPSKILMDTLNNLTEQPVTFHVDMETFGIEMVTSNGRFRLAGENAIDFPTTKFGGSGTSLAVKASVLSKAIASTMFAASSDDMRPAMTGVYFQFGDAYTTFAATDGHRLVRYRRTDLVSEEEHNVILPRKTLNLLKSSLPNDDNVEVTVTFDASNAYFEYNNIKLSCRIIDERYPDYEAAIPTGYPNKLLFNRTEFLSSLKRIDIYANRHTHQVRLSISPDKVVVSAEDIDFSNEGSETIACEYDGDPMDIGFNARFLIEMLQNLDSNLIEMHLQAPNKQGLIYPKEKDASEDITMLVMPVMLNTYVQ